MFDILKEFASLKDTYNGDVYALMLNVIGGCLIALTFVIIGGLCVVMAKPSEERSKRGVAITKMFGLFLITCGISRFVNVLCTWHNLAILDGWLKLLTGVISLITLLYIPSAIRESLQRKQMLEASQMLNEAKKHLGEVKKINEKLNDPE